MDKFVFLSHRLDDRICAKMQVICKFSGTPQENYTRVSGRNKRADSNMPVEESRDQEHPKQSL